MSLTTSVTAAIPPEDELRRHVQILYVSPELLMCCLKGARTSADGKDITFWKIDNLPPSAVVERIMYDDFRGAFCFRVVDASFPEVEPAHMPPELYGTCRSEQYTVRSRYPSLGEVIDGAALRLSAAAKLTPEEREAAGLWNVVDKYDIRPQADGGADATPGVRMIPPDLFGKAVAAELTLALMDMGRIIASRLDVDRPAGLNTLVVRVSPPHDPALAARVRDLKIEVRFDATAGHDGPPHWVPESAPTALHNPDGSVEVIDAKVPGKRGREFI